MDHICTSESFIVQDLEPMKGKCPICCNRRKDVSGIKMYPMCLRKIAKPSKFISICRLSNGKFGKDYNPKIEGGE